MKKVTYLVAILAVAGLLSSCQPEDKGCMDSDAINYNGGNGDCIYRRNLLVGSWSVADTHTGCITGTNNYNCTISVYAEWDWTRVELSTFGNLVPSNPVIMSFEHTTYGSGTTLTVDECHIFIPPSYTDWTVGGSGMIDDDNHMTIFYYAFRNTGASCNYNGQMVMAKN